MNYDIRSALPEDAAALTDLLNHTISLGGSTAYETPFTPESFAEEFFTGPHVHSTRVALFAAVPVGFQSLFFLEDDPPNMAIATFAELRSPNPGVGGALFPATSRDAKAAGASYIRAVIRADNVSGLKYYRGRGFQDFDVRQSVPLQDGTPVDRIETRFHL